MSAAATTDPGLEAQIEKYRPKRPEERASGGTLWHLNTHGLLGEALMRTARAERIDEADVEHEALCPGLIVSKGTAWEVMAEAQRAGVRFGS